MSEEADNTLKETGKEIEKRYEIKFLEIGTEGEYVHVPVPSAPAYGPSKIARTIKSIRAKEIFKKHPEVKGRLWGGEFWFANNNLTIPRGRAAGIFNWGRFPFCRNKRESSSADTVSIWERFSTEGTKNERAPWNGTL
ncbi:MAG: transposase [Treponema sp.]|jgi:hypothetical protein|nr:transposase [Treponema sp.]